MEDKIVILEVIDFKNKTRTVKSRTGVVLREDSLSEDEIRNYRLLISPYRELVADKKQKKILEKMSLGNSNKIKDNE